MSGPTRSDPGPTRPDPARPGPAHKDAFGRVVSLRLVICCSLFSLSFPGAVSPRCPLTASSCPQGVNAHRCSCLLICIIPADGAWRRGDIYERSEDHVIRVGVTSVGRGTHKTSHRELQSPRYRPCAISPSVR